MQSQVLETLNEFCEGCMTIRKHNFYFIQSQCIISTSEAQSIIIHHLIDTVHTFKFNTPWYKMINDQWWSVGRYTFVMDKQCLKNTKPAFKVKFQSVVRGTQRVVSNGVPIMYYINLTNHSQADVLSLFPCNWSWKNCKIPVKHRQCSFTFWYYSYHRRWLPSHCFWWSNSHRCMRDRCMRVSKILQISQKLSN